MELVTGKLIHIAHCIAYSILIKQSGVSSNNAMTITRNSVPFKDFSRNMQVVRVAILSLYLEKCSESE
ncbi:hypothetical protein T4D_17180 [Trichinella pseudospiralis]|uniref:Uncharacterized protein n=1 Tax=Trichinella pseudospiralis TaxID=6337 RepID=A0A0V1F2Z2_TRIPS|nr:hypothetical protein T4D_17180 [Trichinella pseudospiralis]